MRPLDSIEKPFLRKRIPRFDIGDTVDIHVKIIEGEKERIQIFSGTVIARKGSGLSETFTVRRIIQGEGIERIFPLHSPRIASIETKKKGKIRRAKLYYLRERTGKAIRIEEKIGAQREGPTTADVAAAAEAAEKASEPKPEQKTSGEAKPAESLKK